MRLGGVFVSLALLATCAAAARGDVAGVAPPIFPSVRVEHERHGVVIAARHTRTRLVTDVGQFLWNNPSCGHARIVDDWWLVGGRYASIDPPTWLRLPVRASAWDAVGIVPGMHIRFAPSGENKGRVQEIVEADPSVRAGFYCIYEEFYRSPGDPAAGGAAFWSRWQIYPPATEQPAVATPEIPPLTSPRQMPIFVDNSGWPTPPPPVWLPAPSFFPPRPLHAEMHYRSGVLIGFGAGMKSGGASIRDAQGKTFTFFIGWPTFIDGKQTRCATPPRHGERVDPGLCDGGWPSDIVMGVTRVRVYYWHAVTPWGEHVVVTDQIDRAP